jgi:alpha-mannosidase
MNQQRTIHLICNAHLDPVWLWQWPDGAGQGLSTFRIAAQFCEEFGGFVFNHNEALLYEWIRKFDPELFRRIQKLVKEDKWHIMGGWYLQPDCNMPSGESFVRQILYGRKFFDKYFNVRPKTAINFDPFGHSRGLAQILVKSGFDSYLFGRPRRNEHELEGNTFEWVGFDGSKVLAHRFNFPYNSEPGKGKDKLVDHLKNDKEDNITSLLWGVGNHGGGPSEKDLKAINKLIENNKSSVQIKHSTPENYFNDLRESGKEFPQHTKDLNPWAVGCYTSQILIKQGHRQLENELYSLEKMVTNAWAQGLMEYPYEKIREITEDLLYVEFHDILPGSAIKSVEKASISVINHGLEIASRLKTQAFFALSADQKQAQENEIPLLVYNPHPYTVKDIVECEFMTEFPRADGKFTNYKVYKDGELLPSQHEKEESNVGNDWSKRIIFETQLQPLSMNRFDCRCEVIDKKPKPEIKENNGRAVFENDRMKFVINTKTGLVDKYEVDGTDLLSKNAFQPVALQDNEDPWGMICNHFSQESEPFKLLDEKTSAKFSGVRKEKLPAVRLIEQGQVRDVVEVVFGYEDSRICQRYKIPKKGTEVEIELILHCNAFNKMFKLEIPTVLDNPEFIGEVAYGRQNLPKDGTEAVSQKWIAMSSEKQNKVLTLINDGVYGSDFNDNQLRISLLRTPSYSAHPDEESINIPKDRYNPKSDQGKREFKFWLNGGEIKQRMESIARRAQTKSEQPISVCYFPSGKGEVPKSLINIDDEVVQITALKKAENSDDIIIRLFEPTGSTRSVKLESILLDTNFDIRLKPFEIKTLKLNPKSRKLQETNLLEEEM